MSLFAAMDNVYEEPIIFLLSSIMGIDYDKASFLRTGERIFNLEKMFNYCEDFRREDDWLPDRFFENAFTIGLKKDSVLNKDKFRDVFTQYYKERGWDPETTKPGEAKLRELGLNAITS